MMEGETQALHALPEHARKLLGNYEGLRAYNMLPLVRSAGRHRASVRP